MNRALRYLTAPMWFVILCGSLALIAYKALG